MSQDASTLANQASGGAPWANRWSTPAVQTAVFITLIGLVIIILADTLNPALRILGIVVLSVGAAAAGWAAGWPEAAPLPSAGPRRIWPAVLGIALAAAAPIAALLAWGSLGSVAGWLPDARIAPPLGGLVPTRQVLFNVGLAGQVALYALMGPPVAILAYGLARRGAMWRRGKAEPRRDQLGRRLWCAVSTSLLHQRIARRSNLYGGIMHLCLFWGFTVLLIGTIIVMIESDITVPLFGFDFYRGNFYLGYKVAMNLGGLALILGTLMAFAARWRKPVVKQTTTDDLVILGFLLLLCLQGFALQGLRLAAVNDAWAGWSFGSDPVALLVLPLPVSSLGVLHAWMWWTHFITTFLFVGYVAFSKMIHPFTALLQVMFRRLKPLGELDAIANMEEAESFGLGKLEDFAWPQLLSVDACMHCGRCLEYCPTFNTGKPLHPRDLILELAGYQADEGGIFSGVAGEAGNEARFRSGSGPGRALVGGVVSPEEVWDCTTCGACMEQCPVYIEHVPIIVGLRRNLVLEQADFPRELVSLYNNVEKNFNPWEYPAESRGAWARELGVQTLREHPTAEVLYWVGCYGSFDDRNNKVARALVACLQAAGVDFAILGREEKCSGEPLRRTGNEYLYQTLATENVQTLNSYNVHTVITACPHCFNTIAHEYPQFGGTYRVIHHTQFVAELIAGGKLRPAKQVARSITYHDSCYLGRYNGIYDAPRDVLSALPGVQLREMSMNRRTSLCCGGGGGRVFMEEQRGSRINQLRVTQAAATGAEVVASACPFCLTMLEDGVGSKDLRESLRPQDVVELIAAALP
ncbi:MAG: (Fe-S)-binding protein [Chloroflexota bacterium]